MTMYISKIELTNIRCFERVEISFPERGSSIAFTGDNGDGKSTLLRCVAIGLCDETSAGALHRELAGDLVRKSNEDLPGTIAINLVDNNSETRYKIVTTIKSFDAFERVSQLAYINDEKKEPDDFPWEKIFVSAYGAGSRIEGAENFKDYLAVDSVYSLFKYGTTLQNPELAFRRMITPPIEIIQNEEKKEEKSVYEKEMSDFLMKILKRMLLLEENDSILLTNTGIELQLSDNHFELRSQGDGHQAIFTTAIDLLSWWMIYVVKSGTKHLDQKEVCGIVLIDEIEQHLHPSWQMRILNLFQESFPKVQFLVSTHSPLVARISSFSSQTDRRCRLFRHHRPAGPFADVRVEEVPKSLDVLDFDQMLASEAFQVTDRRDPEISGLLRDASELAVLTQRTEDQDLRLKEIKTILKSVMFPKGLTPIERMVERDYYEDLQKKADQLKNLLGKEEHDSDKKG